MKVKNLIMLFTIFQILLIKVFRLVKIKSNKLIRKNGEIKKFKFNIKSHVELGAKNNNIDFENSIKLSGSRFVVLRDKFALLERALINFMLDTHVNFFNYTEISPPLIATEKTMFGTGQLPKFEDDQFEIKFDNSGERKFLIPTSEVVLTNLVSKSTLNKSDLPIRYVATHVLEKRRVVTEKIQRA